MKINLSITVDDEEVFQTNGFEWKMCGEDHKEIVMSALSESMVMICGGTPKPEPDTRISYRRNAPAPVLKMVPASPVSSNHRGTE